MIKVEDYRGRYLNNLQTKINNSIVKSEIDKMGELKPMR